jgi:N-hydroxyarylamine O-acetyltransferase
MNVDAYLDRIGAERPARADTAALGELQERHLRSVPFENLSIHLGEPIVLDEEALFDKVVRRRRGGFCYELNGLFGALLSALGYQVTLLAARVYDAEGVPGPPFAHLALRVDLDQPWLVDVGFGRFSGRPLRLAERGDQADLGGTFRIEAAEYGELTVSRDGTPEYLLEPRPRRLGEFEPTCWWTQTSPRSHFTRSLVCSMLAGTGRVTLSGRTLTRTVERRLADPAQVPARDDAGRDERVLGTDAEVLAAYRDEFGIVLDRVPTVLDRS